MSRTLVLISYFPRKTRFSSEYCGCTKICKILTRNAYFDVDAFALDINVYMYFLNTLALY